MGDELKIPFSFFRKAIRPGAPIATEGFADGIAGIDKALCSLDVEPGRVEWRDGRPLIVIDEERLTAQIARHPWKLYPHSDTGTIWIDVGCFWYHGADIAQRIWAGRGPVTVAMYGRFTDTNISIPGAGAVVAVWLVVYQEYSTQANTLQIQTANSHDEAQFPASEFSLTRAIRIGAVADNGSKITQDLRSDVIDNDNALRVSHPLTIRQFVPPATWQPVNRYDGAGDRLITLDMPLPQDIAPHPHYPPVIDVSGSGAVNVPLLNGMIDELFGRVQQIEDRLVAAGIFRRI